MHGNDMHGPAVSGQTAGDAAEGVTCGTTCMVQAGKKISKGSRKCKVSGCR